MPLACLLLALLLGARQYKIGKPWQHFSQGIAVVLGER
jgi:hypothetical protein